jgi:hypothetical protein
VNEVASPVKFGEYLASGLPVVMSAGIGDYSELVRRKKVGVILKGRPASAPGGWSALRSLRCIRSPPPS